jgi:hypothetical protein
MMILPPSTTAAADERAYDIGETSVHLFAYGSYLQAQDVRRRVCMRVYVCA